MRSTTLTATAFILEIEKMRKLFLYIVSVVLLFSACYGDRDQQGDDTLQQVTAVSGISADTYVLYQGDTLRLQPDVSFSEGADTTVYDYRWLVGRSELIGEGRELAWPVRLPEGYAMAGNVPGVFVARNRLNGLEFRQTFTLQVLSNYTPAYFCVYEKSDGRLEWMSLQGEPREFTRWFDDMVERINPGEPLTGNYRGTLYSMNELAVFTDHHPDYGRSISVRNADPQAGFLYNVGEYTGTVHETLYHGSSPTLDIGNVVFGYGASKYLICNKTLYVFNGLDRKLPIFNEQTFVKSQGVRQAMSSKQFQRYKKCTFVLHDDGTVGAYHVYNDQMERLMIDGQPFRLDSLCGCFTEATGLGSNQPYDIYLVGQLDGEYAMYQFHVNYVNRVVQPLTLVRRMPLDAGFARSVIHWWGSFGESYGYYLQGQSVYRFDYLEMTEFQPGQSRQLITFADDEEVVDVFPQIPGLGLRDEDDCLVILIYNKVTRSSTIYVCNSFNGRLLRRYDGIVPGRALFFSKCL